MGQTGKRGKYGTRNSKKSIVNKTLFCKNGICQSESFAFSFTIFLPHFALRFLFSRYSAGNFYWAKKNEERGEGGICGDCMASEFFFNVSH